MVLSHAAPFFGRENRQYFHSNPLRHFLVPLFLASLLLLFRCSVLCHWICRSALELKVQQISRQPRSSSAAAAAATRSVVPRGRPTGGTNPPSCCVHSLFSKKATALKRTRFQLPHAQTQNELRCLLAFTKTIPQHEREDYFRFCCCFIGPRLQPCGQKIGRRTFLQGHREWKSDAILIER